MAAEASRRTGSRHWIIALVAGLVGGLLLGAASTAGRERMGAGGLPFWLENTGGLWIAVAFAVGAPSRRRVAGALAGVLAMIAAVMVYDLAKLAGLSGGILLRPFWLMMGIAVGIAFGALGGWWGEQSARRWLPAGLTGGVIAGEVAALSVGGLPHAMFSSKLGVIQAILGVGGASLLAGPAGWWRAAGLAVAVAVAIGVAELATGVPGRLIW